MRVLIVHNNNSHISGPETYMYSIKEHFKCFGHDCEIFSFFDGSNSDDPLNKFLPHSLVKGRNWNNDYGRLNLFKLSLLFLNSFFNISVYKSLRRSIRFYKPDIIYLLQFHLKLSSSVIDAAKIEGIPVVCRVSDFNRLCSKNILYRDNGVCMKCTKNSYYSVHHNCLNNRFYSILDFLVRQFDKKRKIYDYIKFYVAPSIFTKEIFEIIPDFRNKFYVIPTGIMNLNLTNYENLYDRKYDFIYFGRVSYDKGVDLIIDAFNRIKREKPFSNLKIIGEFDDYMKDFEYDAERIATSNKLIKNELHDYVRVSKFTIFYSRWYDNLPNSLIESASLGVPVIVPIFGSFKDLINQGLPCIPFDPNIQGDLDLALIKALEISDSDYLELSKNSRLWILNYCNMDAHYHQLHSVFLKAISHH